MTRFKADDLALLLPSFERKARQVLAEMVARGYDPVPFDTLRTPAEAAKLFARGVGSANSMHLYGAACDVICGAHGWQCGSHGCRFYEAYGEEVERAGCTWGGRWKRNDLPHMQGIPVSAQATFRSIPASMRDAFCAKFIGAK